MMIVERLPDGIEVGYCALFENDRVGSGESDMLIALLPEYQARGYGREVLELMRNRWMATLGRHHCTATVNPYNTASIKLLERCGFAKVGECESKAGRQHIYRYE